MNRLTSLAAASIITAGRVYAMTRQMKKTAAGIAVGMGIGALTGAGLSYAMKPSGKKMLRKKVNQAADMFGDLIDSIGYMMK